MTPFRTPRLAAALPWLLLAAPLLVLPRAAQASAGYPQALVQQLQLQPPGALPCMLCHESQQGGTGTAVRPFAVALQARGLRGTSRTDLLQVALGTLEREATDSDGDGTPDVTELRALRDPNRDPAGADDGLFSAEAAPEPLSYGCSSASGAAPALVVLLLGVRRRRECRRPTGARAALPCALLLLLGPLLGHAQQVLVLPVERDARGQLRAQLERAVRAQGLSSVPLRRYLAAAARSGLPRQAAFAEDTVARVAPRLGATWVLRGSRGRMLELRLSDAAGTLRWRAALGLNEGRLTRAALRELGQALAAANAPAPERAAGEPPREASPALPAGVAGGAALVAVEGDGTHGSAAPAASRPPPPLAHGDVAEPGLAEEGGGDALAWGAPARWRVSVLGTSTWRRSCARPGARSCAEFDRRPTSGQQGATLDFNRRFDLLAPATGLALQLDLRPWAGRDSWLQGWGLTLAVHRAASSALEPEAGRGGPPSSRTVDVADTAVRAQLIYRQAFRLPGARSGQPPASLGVRSGLLQRRFVVDAQPSLSSRRAAAFLGVELALPLARLAQVEAGSDWLLRPHPRAPGPLGSPTSSSGWSAHFGLRADLPWRLQAALRFEYTRFRDQLSGLGTLPGWEAGGIAQEEIATGHWGLAWQL